MHDKKRVEETRTCISLYRVLTVEPRDRRHSSRYMLGHVSLVSREVS